MPLYAPISHDDQPPVPTEQANGIVAQETVIILDWDDTLLCSSFLSANNVRLDSPLADLALADDSASSAQLREVASQLKQLETCVVQLLQLSLARPRTTVHIVTNAEHGWVQLSAAKFFPSVVPLLAGLSIISARSSYEHLFPDSPLKWKYYSMHQKLVGGGLFGTDGRAEVQKHVISLGDSHVEREAVRALCRGVPSTHVKTVKFAQSPTCEQLRRQLELVVQCFGYINDHPADLDLQLTVTVNPDTPAAPASAPSATAASAPEQKREQLEVPMESADPADDALTTTEAKDITPKHAQSKLAHETHASRNELMMA